MAPTYKLALIQLHPVPSAPSSNFDRAARFIRSAAAQGAHLAVLPEYVLSGWTPQDPEWAVGNGAEGGNEWLKKFQELAKECRICLVPGTFVERHEDGLYNVAYFVDHEGSVLGRPYRKKNLWHPERQHLAAGIGPEDAHEVISTPLGKVGLLICWDLAFPEAFRLLITQGAELIIVPAFWTLDDITAAGKARNPDSEAVFLNSAVVLRAYENTAGVAFVNAGGPAEKGYAGLSMVAMPFVGPVVKATGSGEQMVFGEVDMEILREAEESYKVREDLGREGWHYKASM